MTIERALTELETALNTVQTIIEDAVDEHDGMLILGDFMDYDPFIGYPVYALFRVTYSGSDDGSYIGVSFADDPDEQKTLMEEYEKTHTIDSTSGQDQCTLEELDSNYLKNILYLIHTYIK